MPGTKKSKKSFNDEIEEKIAEISTTNPDANAIKDFEALKIEFVAKQEGSKTLIKNVSQLNDTRDSIINSEALKIMTEGFLDEFDSEWREGETDSEKLKKKRIDYIKSLSPDEKERIINEYRTNSRVLKGDGKFEADLADAYETKKHEKARYKDAAQEILKKYEEALERTRNNISKLSEEIESIDKSIAELEASKPQAILKDSESTIMNSNGKVLQTAKFDSEDAVKKANAAIKELNVQRKAKVDELSQYQKLQTMFEGEFDKRKDALLKALAKQKIFLNDVDMDIEETNVDDITINNSSNNSLNSSLINEEKPLTRADRARNMLTDFRRKSPDERSKLLNGENGTAIMDMAEELRMWNRSRFRRELKKQQSYLGVTDININDKIKIKANDLKEGKLSEEQCIAIIQWINEFDRNLASKTPKEMADFEKELQSIRIASLIRTPGRFMKFLSNIPFLRNAQWIRDRDSQRDLANTASAHAYKASELKKREEEQRDRNRRNIGRKAIDPMAKESNVRGLSQTQLGLGAAR